MTIIQEIILNVLTEEPRTQKEIVEDMQERLVLSFSTRYLRNQFKKINEAFIDGESEWIVVSSKKGSYKTKDCEAIRRFNQAKRNHALSELKMAYNANKRINSDMNKSMYEFIADMVGEQNDSFK